MESVHENPKKSSDAGLFEKLSSLPQAIFGRKLEAEELIIGALIVLMLTNRIKSKGEDREENKEEKGQKDQGLSPLLNGVKDFLAKLEDKDILTIMLLYIML